MKQNEQKISFLSKIGYGIGNLGYGIVFQSLAAYLLFYSTAVLGVRGRYIGTIMAIGIFWDAITDPLMGYISDITFSRKWGRRHLYLMIGAVTASIFNLMLWHISPGLTPNTKLILILIFLMLLKTSLTIYGTPYTALGAELSMDYNERTSIQSFKTVAFLLGLAFPMVAGLLIFFKETPEYSVGQLNPAGYSMMGLATSGLMLITSFICIASTFSYRFKNIPNQADKIKRKMSMTEAVRNKHFIYIFFTYIFVNVSSALIGSIGLHVFTYTFELNSNIIALVMGVFFGGSILSLPIWLMRSKKHDKKPIMIECLKISMVASVMFFGAVLLRPIIIKFNFLLLPIVLLLGFGSGGLFMLPPSMTADTIDYEEKEKGYRSEGVYYGALTFGYKIIQSLILFLVGIMLDVVKFDSGLSTQTLFTSLSLGVILSVGSLIAFGIAYFFINKYHLSQAMVDEIQIHIKSQKQPNVL
ncbi:MAG: MFS transporter [Tissierellales bacterium]|nr:MFS transporter [Tissierellales bacterium]MBN2827103.1 MFS transporter [Tissierellales bacterium]